MEYANALLRLRSARLAGAGAALLALAGAGFADDVFRGGAPPPRASAATPARPELTLVWFDVQRQLPLGYELMAEEVRWIFAEAGVTLAWRRSEPGGTFGDGPGLELPVILLAEDPLRSRRQQPILGLVVQGQAPTRNIWAFAGNLKRALDLDPERVLGPEQAALVARALARVIAHELVHALAPGLPHGRRGLMSQSLGRAALVGSRRALALDYVRSVRAGLAALAAHGPAPWRTAERIASSP